MATDIIEMYTMMFLVYCSVLLRLFTDLRNKAMKSKREQSSDGKITEDESGCFVQQYYCASCVLVEMHNRLTFLLSY